MIVNQALVNQTTFWPVLNISVAVFTTDAAYQFDTSYACQAYEVTGDNSPSLVIVKILKQFERVRYPYQAYPYQAFLLQRMSRYSYQCMNIVSGIKSVVKLIVLSF